MLILEDSIHINVPPEKLFDFFNSMSSDRYRSWHPDHLDFKWIGSSGAVRGNRFWFRETVGGKTMDKTVFFTEVEKDRYLEFALTNWFFRLILRKFSFRMQPISSGTLFIARIEILTGPIGTALNKREFDAVRVHMKEEGENLKPVVESLDKGE